MGKTTKKLNGLNFLFEGSLSPIVWLLSIGGFTYALTWIFRSPDLPNPDQINNAANIAAKLGLLAVVSGVAAMALVEIWKNLGNGKANFHRRALKRECGVLYEKWKPPVDLPLEQLMAQLATEMENALNDPLKNDDVFLSLKEQTRLDVEGQEKNALQENDVVAAFRLLRKIESSGAKYPEEIEQDKIKALTVLRQTSERGLDRIQYAIGSSWRRVVRLNAMIFSGTIGFAVLLLTETSLPVKIAIGFNTLLLGGFFSWVARDILAAIQRLRG